MDLSDVENTLNSISALECVEQLCGSASDLHVVAPDGLASLLGLIRQNLQPIPTQTKDSSEA